MFEYDELLKLMGMPNWEKILEEKGISINWDNEYVILKYRFLSCDFSDPVVRACRGVILKKENDSFRIVCAPFIKFSYGDEEWENPIDWTSAKVRDKIDGSLMKAFYDDGWKLSTNSIIDAFKAHSDDERIANSFGELFEFVIGDNFECWAEKYLDRNYTYMFELATPYNRVVIPYKDSKVWYLSRRNMITMEEDDSDIPGLIRPKLHKLNNINDTLRVVSDMIDEEGVVVYDKYFNRIKVKSPDYLIKHGLSHNKVVTMNIIIKMLKEESIDDYIAYFGDADGYITKVVNAFKNHCNRLDFKWNYISSPNCSESCSTMTVKEFAEFIKDDPNKDYFFYKFRGGESCAKDYVLKESKKYISKFIEEELE